MTFVTEFVIGILGRIVSGIFTTYIVRFVDKFLNKNNRQEL